MLLLFPTGRLYSRRWRPAAWFVAAVFTLDLAAQAARACRVWADPFIAPGDGWYPGSHSAVLILTPAALLAGGAAVTARFARSSGEERLQLKWFAMAALLVLAAIIPLGLNPQIALSPAAESVAEPALKVVFCLTLVCLYAAIAVAVLKYRLYDIDRLISRTLAYAMVTGLLVGVYAGPGTARHRGTPLPHAGRGGRRHPGRRGAVRARCGGGCSGLWTVGSTGPGMTPTRP